MPQTPSRPRVLFLCTGNSCRSQIAEGFAKAFWSDRLDACSAGVEPHGMNRLAIRCTAEVGVDLSHGRSKHVNELLRSGITHVISVCSHAKETCPVFPGHAKVLHVGFDDPPALAKDAPNDDAAMAHYRRVRDEIRDYIRTRLPADLDLA